MWYPKNDIQPLNDKKFNSLSKELSHFEATGRKFEKFENDNALLIITPIRIQRPQIISLDLVYTV